MVCNNCYRTFGLSVSLGLALTSFACSDEAPAPNAGVAGTGTSMTPSTGVAGTTTGAAGTTTVAGSGGAGTAAAAGTSGATSTGAAGTTTTVAGSGGAGVAGASGPGGDVMVAAGAGGSAEAGAAAAAGSGGAAGAPPTMMDFGKGDGTDVITIGDSWMNILTNGGGIEGGLDRLDTKYRHYAVAGTTLINGDIPAQYDRAKRANPNIKTIIMTGGGNDVMFSNGCSTKAACTEFSQRIADALDELWTTAVADGVTTTVYIQYSRNAGTAPEDTRPDTQPVPKICTSGKLKCLSVPTTDIIARTDLLDGIHPNSAGCDRIAKATLDLMEMSGARR